LLKLNIVPSNVNYMIKSINAQIIVNFNSELYLNRSINVIEGPRFLYDDTLSYIRSDSVIYCDLFI